MRIKLQLFIIGILFSFNLYAEDVYYPQSPSQDQPWSVTASVGKGKYQSTYPNDADTVLARLALNNELMLAGDFSLGLEFGLQNGHRMRLKIPYKTLAVLEMLPVQSTLGPMFDLLITAKSDPLSGSSLYAQLKGGIAYRSWRIQQSRINDLAQLAGEIQAGFGYPLTALASLSLLYQGVFGYDPYFQWNFDKNIGHVSNIPALHALLLGFSVNL